MEYTISLKAHRKIIDQYKKDIDQNRYLSKELAKLKELIENKSKELVKLNTENDKLKSEVCTLNEKLDKKPDKVKETPEPGIDTHDHYMKKYPKDFAGKYYTIATGDTSVYGYISADTDTATITDKMGLKNDKSDSDKLLKSESKFSKLTKRHNKYIKSMLKKMNVFK